MSFLLVAASFALDYEYIVKDELILSDESRQNKLSVSVFESGRLIEKKRRRNLESAPRIFVGSSLLEDTCHHHKHNLSQFPFITYLFSVRVAQKWSTQDL